MTVLTYLMLVALAFLVRAVYKEITADPHPPTDDERTGW